MAGASTLVFLEYLTTVFDNIQDGVLLVSAESDGRYKLLLANAAFQRSTGHTKPDFGKHIDEIISESSYKTLKVLYRKAVEQKTTIRQTGWYDVPVGRRAFENTFIPVFNAVGEVIQLAIITRDVTELLNLREQVKDAASLLEKTARQIRHEQK